MLNSSAPRLKESADNPQNPGPNAWAEITTSRAARALSGKRQAEGRRLEVCRDSELELGFEKIAIYTRNGLVQHVSRQLASGRWTSKMASGCDAEHVTPEILAGGCCEVSLYMRHMRRIATGEGPQLPPLKPPPSLIFFP
jgi:hypothetical protein